jgi:outer membrane protein assembly factor BamE (lipoprotein component of BamABCDE complex)
MKKIVFALVAFPTLFAGAKPGYFPEIEDGWKDEYEVISVHTLRQLKMGMTRHQVYHLLGEPHFNEGIRSRTWNYALALQAEAPKAAMNCSLQLVYDKGRIAEVKWQRPECEAAVK